MAENNETLEHYVPKEMSIQPYKLGSDVPARIEKKRQEVAQVDVADDFEYARSNLKDLVETGSSALTTLLDLAQSAENPRAFEVLANTIKTLAEVNKDLLDIHERRLKIEASQVKATENTPNSVTNIQNNVVFSGTNSEINDVIEKMVRAKKS